MPPKGPKKDTAAASNGRAKREREDTAAAPAAEAAPPAPPKPSRGRKPKVAPAGQPTLAGFFRPPPAIAVTAAPATAPQPTAEPSQCVVDEDACAGSVTSPPVHRHVMPADDFEDTQTLLLGAASSAAVPTVVAASDVPAVDATPAGNAAAAPSPVDAAVPVRRKRGRPPKADGSTPQPPAKSPAKAPAAKSTPKQATKPPKATAKAPARKATAAKAAKLEASLIAQELSSDSDDAVVVGSTTTAVLDVDTALSAASNPRAAAQAHACDDVSSSDGSVESVAAPATPKRMTVVNGRIVFGTPPPKAQPGATAATASSLMGEEDVVDQATAAATAREAAAAKEQEARALVAAFQRPATAAPQVTVWSTTCMKHGTVAFLKDCAAACGMSASTDVRDADAEVTDELPSVEHSSALSKILSQVRAAPSTPPIAEPSSSQEAALLQSSALRCAVPTTVLDRNDSAFVGLPLSSRSAAALFAPSAVDADLRPPSPDESSSDDADDEDDLLLRKSDDGHGDDSPKSETGPSGMATLSAVLATCTGEPDAVFNLHPNHAARLAAQTARYTTTVAATAADASQAHRLWAAKYGAPRFAGTARDGAFRRLRHWLRTWRRGGIGTLQEAIAKERNAKKAKKGTKPKGKAGRPPKSKADAEEPASPTTANDAHRGSGDSSGDESVWSNDSDPDGAATAWVNFDPFSLESVTYDDGVRQSSRVAARELQARKERAERLRRECFRLKGYFPDEDIATEGLRTAVAVVCGPVGAGSTSLVEAAATAAGYRVMEVGPGVRRTPAMITKLFAEATQAMQVSAPSADAASGAFAVSGEVMKRQLGEMQEKAVREREAKAAADARRAALEARRKRNADATSGLKTRRPNTISQGAISSFFSPRVPAASNTADTGSAIEVDDPAAVAAAATTDVDCGNDADDVDAAPAPVPVPKVHDRAPRSMVLFEAADVIFTDEHGLYPAIRGLIESSKCPVVLTVNDPHQAAHLASSLGGCPVLSFDELAAGDAMALSSSDTMGSPTASSLASPTGGRDTTKSTALASQLAFPLTVLQLTTIVRAELAETARRRPDAPPRVPSIANIARFLSATQRPLHDVRAALTDLQWLLCSGRAPLPLPTTDEEQPPQRGKHEMAAASSVVNFREIAEAQAIENVAKAATMRSGWHAMRDRTTAALGARAWALSLAQSRAVTFATALDGCDLALERPAKDAHGLSPNAAAPSPRSITSFFSPPLRDAAAQDPAQATANSVGAPPPTPTPLASPSPVAALFQKRPRDDEPSPAVDDAAPSTSAEAATAAAPRCTVSEDPPGCDDNDAAVLSLPALQYAVAVHQGTAAQTTLAPSAASAAPSVRPRDVLPSAARAALCPAVAPGSATAVPPQRPPHQAEVFAALSAEEATVATVCSNLNAMSDAVAGLSAKTVASLTPERQTDDRFPNEDRHPTRKEMAARCCKQHKSQHDRAQLRTLPALFLADHIRFDMSRAHTEVRCDNAASDAALTKSMSTLTEVA